MANKQHSRSRNVVSKLRHNRVPTRQPASTRAYRACRALECPKAVLEFLGISYSEAGQEYARLIGGKAGSRQAVYKALNGKRLSDDWSQVLGQLLSNHLTRICREPIGIDIMQNSPMHVTPYRYCDDCGSLYAIDRPDVRRCKKCRK